MRLQIKILSGSTFGGWCDVRDRQFGVEFISELIQPNDNRHQHE
jgi:hypothetical protein